MCYALLLGRGPSKTPEPAKARPLPRQPPPPRGIESNHLQESDPMIKIMLHPEVLRRLAVLVGLLMAVWFYLWPAEYVYSVSLVDFRAAQQKERWKDDRNMPLDQYMAKKVEGRLKQVSGPQWQELLKAMLRAQNGPLPEMLQDRLYTIGRGYAKYYYFGPDDEPMASVGMPRDGYTYLTMTMDGRRYFMGLSSQLYRWASNAPSWLLYPTRGYAWVPLLLGLLGYLFIPRRKHPEGAYTYGRFSSQIGPDILGLLFAGVFFGLPLLIIPDNSDIWSVFNFDGGWTVLTLIFWGPMAACGVALLGVAARYASIWLQVGAKDFTRASLRGVEHFKYSDIAKAQPYERHAPRWLVWGLMFFGAGNPTAMGQALLIQGNIEVGWELHLRDGRKVRIMINSLEGAEKLPKAWAKAGVRVEMEPGKK